MTPLEGVATRPEIPGQQHQQNIQHVGEELTRAILYLGNPITDPVESADYKLRLDAVSCLD
jgi:hypothetical protein